MNEEMRVKYLFINMRYPLYIKLQTIFVIAWLIAAIASFFLAQNSQVWFFKNGPWLYPIIALLQVGEAFIAIKKSKKESEI